MVEEEEEEAVNTLPTDPDPIPVGLALQIFVPCAFFWCCYGLLAGFFQEVSHMHNTCSIMSIGIGIYTHVGTLNFTLAELQEYWCSVPNFLVIGE